MSLSQPDWRPSKDGRFEERTQFWGRTKGTKRIRALLTARVPLDDVPAPIRACIVKWVTQRAAVERRIDSLMSSVKPHEIVNAETALDLLLERGWVEVLERGLNGIWKRSAIAFTDLAALRKALGITNEAKLWRDAARDILGEGEKAAIVGRQAPLLVPGLGAVEVMRRLARIPDYVDRQLYLRAVSSELFGGRSKVLDGREMLVAAVLGVQVCPFPEIPIRLEVFLPQNWKGGVLFIENPLAFEAARRTPFAACADLALVLAHGFMASARRVRGRQTASVYAHVPANEHDTQRFDHWLHSEDDARRQIYFWGDLDFSGMNILKELRVVFPEMLAWRPGYTPMVRAIEAGEGHPPSQADKENQVDPSHTGCPYADKELLPAIRKTGFFYDQEGIVPCA